MRIEIASKLEKTGAAAVAISWRSDRVLLRRSLVNPFLVKLFLLKRPLIFLVWILPKVMSLPRLIPIPLFALLRFVIIFLVTSPSRNCRRFRAGDLYTCLSVNFFRNLNHSNVMELSLSTNHGPRPCAFGLWFELLGQKVFCQHHPCVRHNVEYMCF